MTATTTRASAAATSVTGTLLLAAVCWVVAVRQMNGMDMGRATELGSLWSFAALWVVMMAAMMLPGATAAIAAQPSRSVPLYVVSYLAVWAVIGLVVYALYREHGPDAAGAVVIAAGVYELTPVKRHFRQRCLERVRTGLEFGLCCVGSSAGLMAVLVALGVMSVGWMVVIAVVVLVQKLLPAKTLLDVPVALVIVALGVYTVLAP